MYTPSVESYIPRPWFSTNTDFLEKKKVDAEADKIFYPCQSIISHDCTLNMSEDPMSGNIANHQL